MGCIAYGYDYGWELGYGGRALLWGVGNGIGGEMDGLGFCGLRLFYK